MSIVFAGVTSCLNCPNYSESGLDYLEFRLSYS